VTNSQLRIGKRLNLKLIKTINVSSNRSQAVGGLQYQ